jgi:hypothetical protein
MSFLLESLPVTSVGFPMSDHSPFQWRHIGNDVGINGPTTSGPGAIGFGVGFGSPSAGSGSGSGSFGAGSGGFRFIERKSPFGIFPIVLLGVMLPVGQILNMFFELLFVHGKIPCPVPDLTLLFFNPT